MQIVILKSDDLNSILGFEEKVFSAAESDPIARQLAQWHSRSRQESLEHYLPMGWSFGAWLDQQLVGYFLAQPLLFFEGVTQTLWVERLVGEDPQVTFQLVDTVVRLAREKHFQRVLFSDCESYVSLLKDLKGKAFNASTFEVRSSKMI